MWMLLLLPVAWAGESLLARHLRPWIEDEAERREIAGACQASLRETATRVGRTPEEQHAVHNRLQDLVMVNLVDKATPPDAPERAFPLDRERILRQVCAYEAWKLEGFVNSGVFPKKYFGYLDGQWDTAADELLLRDTVDRAVPLANAELARRGYAFRLTDQEVIATWLAEGGTLLLGDERAHQGNLDAIMDIGLDSIVRGYASWMPLIRQFDETFGTDMQTTVVGDRYYLNYDLRESILGTILMLCDERMLLERKLEDAGRPGQAGRPLDEQFILASLHYNSGLMFSDGRARQIRDFTTADYLYDVSERTYPRRPKLNVGPPSMSLEHLLAGNPYPAQWTSWNAVYHVLQRYGGWKGLEEFTDWFTPEGELAPWSAPDPAWP